MVRFIHTADWHLGMQAHSLPDEARVRFAQERFDAVRRIAKLAGDEGCAFVVVSGDVFDSNHVDRAVVAKAIEALSAFTVPVFMLPGNHDPLGPASVYRTEGWTDRKPANVEVLSRFDPIAVPGADGVEVIGAPWHTKHQLVDPLAAAYEGASSAGAGLRVVVGHGIVDELNPDSDDPSAIRAEGMRAALRDEVVHFVALGDRHSVTEIPDTDGRAWYSGTQLSSDYGELEPNDVLLVELHPDGCNVERRTVGTWVFEVQDFDLNSEGDVETLEQWLDAVPSKHTTAVKLALRGTLSLAASAKLDDLLERNRLTFASLNTWQRHTDLVVAPDDADLAGLDVSGYVREALEELRTEAAQSGEEAGAARDALNLLYRLAR